MFRLFLGNIPASSGTTISATVGNAVANGSTALIVFGQLVSGTVGNAVADGQQATIRFGSVVSGEVGNAVANGVTASVTFPSTDFSTVDLSFYGYDVYKKKKEPVDRIRDDIEEVINSLIPKEPAPVKEQVAEEVVQKVVQRDILADAPPLESVRALLKEEVRRAVRQIRRRRDEEYFMVM